MKRSLFIQLLKFNFWCHKHHLRVISKLIFRKIRVKYACDFPPTVKFGNGLVLPHLGLGVVIHPRTVIGDNCKIYQHVTIGVKNGGIKSNPPIIGNNVTIYANSCVLGDIKVGNNAIIAAGAVVLCNVPDNCIAVGVPAIIKTRDNLNNG